MYIIYIIEKIFDTEKSFVTEKIISHYMYLSVPKMIQLSHRALSPWENIPGNNQEINGSPTFTEHSLFHGCNAICV